MVLSASAIKSIAKTMSNIEGNLGVIASQIAGDSYKYQDEVQAAATSLSNAIKTCASAKKTLLSKAILTPEHLIEASQDESKLFDTMVGRVLSIEARATVLHTVLANTYEINADDTAPVEPAEGDEAPIDENACGDKAAEGEDDPLEDDDTLNAEDETDLPEDQPELTAGEDEEGDDDLGDLDLDAEDDDLTDDELGLGDDDVDLQADEDEDDIVEDDDEDDVPAPVTASKKVVKPQTGQSRNAMKRQMVKASTSTPSVTQDLWDFK
jgi:hypothetical protein